ncbi:MAG: bacillithiol biosynthesis BshC [Candidatus Thorarchaeota archaeon]|nr:MAG: bacillithiol biosynthesis BshC [Candidatus Thorarchaeota archaeon]
MGDSVSTVYSDFIWKDQRSALASDLYGNPPKTMGEIMELVSPILAEYEEQGWHDPTREGSLAKALVEINHDLGGLTPRVGRSIDALGSGAIEAAHQSVIAGGPCYVLNKAATARRIADMSVGQENELTPFFFVADYDVVQTELIKIRTPIMGQGGNLISIPVPKGYENSPAGSLPLPNYEWLEDVEEGMKASYRPMFKSLEMNTRKLFEERLEAGLALIRHAFVNSSCLGDFSERILARLLNVEGNLGIPLISASDERIRKLMSNGFEFLLREDIREKFLRVHMEITERIKSSGFIPGAGDRQTNYVPFFYECPGSNCHRSRVEMNYETRGSSGLLTGKCPTCGELVEIEVSTTDPDLKEFAHLLSPRVDSRQFAIDTVLPVIAHVGGEGETAYYAQVIPIANELKVPFPVFVKYPRVYFNTPWNEDLAGQLKEKDLPALHSPEMFKITGKINRSKKKGKSDEMNDALREFHDFVNERHDALNAEVTAIAKKGEKVKKNGSSQEHLAKLDMERYLSWAFGQYSQGKFGQESAWLWIEWTVNSGLADPFGPYMRAYVPEMRNGATLFVNFST